MSAVIAPWRNRIVGQGEESPAELVANPKNWRTNPKAQQEALAGVLDEVGWGQQVLVNQLTGRLVDGHLRVELAARRGETSIPVTYLELSEQEEDLILATLDPLTALAETDGAKLAELLAGIEVDNAWPGRTPQGPRTAPVRSHRSGRDPRSPD